MDASEEEKKFIPSLLETKEREIIEKLGLAKPKGRILTGFENLGGENFPAAYSPGEYQGYEDIYVIGIGTYKLPNIEEIIAHEAMHRLHYWTLSINSNTDPAGYKKLSYKVMGGLTENENQFKALRFFDKVLLETFAYWGEMITLNREVKPHYFKRESPEYIEKFLRIFFPKNPQEEEVLFINIFRKSNIEIETLESLINDVGHTVALGFFKIFKTDEMFIRFMVDYFAGYDIRKIEYNPFLKYLELSRRIELKIKK